ncbi:ABC transporter ATP-binding protein [Convivina intestini]|uniref:Iron complex transport system ATP-binding protein n=1 Tax=Convivina intestini TaxID=1505726 RepID=A0A2U1DC46_9LACO|nr:ABC transporter ATP-binding protein [Convivina intestini]PVY85226.1 iron complex transport system ATP-binding protein [Convivina intestini]CAH1852502.1 putative ABC transporter ATP-binding protein YlmA [Convivina intestini]CAH1854613.1 putative ABC transporter ATP-binding protein YlmA [Convivina intestini]SDC01366.1 iron complex transport system ATP-binding protein [Leuconostocaceae bacterium R-53105]
MTAILKFTNVSVARGNRQILTDINWTIQPQQNWAILGLNGAGKTTLLKMIHGDLWPTDGQIEVLGNKFGQTNIPALQRRIGWVSTALQEQLHVNDNVDKIILSGKFSSIGLYEKYDETDLEAARQTLRNLGGAKLIGKSYSILSQGEKQLILIARALMAKPELLILDEPCNGLDLFAREKLLNQIQQLAQRPDRPALLMVSHHIEEIMPIFNRVLLLKQGRIFQKGERIDLLNRAVLTAFYQQKIGIEVLESGRMAVYPN